MVACPTSSSPDTRHDRPPASLHPTPFSSSSSSSLAIDPRASSTQSLVPSPGSADTRRTLLVIFIHGFYGNDQSFRSFPAHLHALLRTRLAGSHCVHSKVYPRYKTYRSIDVARDRFSAWLEPHESPTTDVILVGHSMGGLLAADVVLMQPAVPSVLQRAYKHRILGTVSLDSPFLGMHPGIIASGIASLFQPAAAQPPTAADQTQASLGSPQPPSSPEAPPSIAATPGPDFDPPFWNDQPFREQPFLKRLLHFTEKHKPEGLFQAVRKHIVSHLEYGGCLADYPALVTRYKQIRSLEDVDPDTTNSSNRRTRVRFANYYTLCSGRPKLPKKEASHESSKVTMQSVKHPMEEASDLTGEHPSPHSSGYRGRERTTGKGGDDDQPIDECKGRPGKLDEGEEGTDGITSLSSLSLCETNPTSTESLDPDPFSDLSLPPIPDEPPSPPILDLSRITDKDARKQAERESKRLHKTHQQCLKDRAQILREREKLLAERRKKARKDVERSRKAASRAPRKERGSSPDEVQAATSRQGPGVSREGEHAVQRARSGTPPRASKKLRKFCCLPAGGRDDDAWVGVYMDGVDEVGAHCGLFAPGPHYDRLVGDLGERIVAWVNEDLAKGN